MLYNRNAVKNRVPISQKMRNFSRANPFFNMPKELKKEIIAVADVGKNDLETVLDITSKFGNYIRYDYSHTYQGIRTATEVFVDRKGHSIEQNVFLYAVLKSLKINPRFTVLKNPKGYINGLSDLGFHLFLRFNSGGKPYLADLVSGGAVEDDARFKYVMRQDMTLNEFFSFYLMDGGEDMIIHGNPGKALEFFNGAFCLDPNNYPVYFAAAEARLQQGKVKNAKKNCEIGVKMAPDIADVYAAYGDILFLAKAPKRKMVEQYEEAVSRETEDVQVLTSLSKSLNTLGQKRLRRIVLERLEKLFEGNPPNNWETKSGNWLYNEKSKFE